ncbi:MAG: hypothetical protein IJS97_00755 [Prevotella sp.]|nr:hypothetical protein [Prevotella sp.]
MIRLSGHFTLGEMLQTRYYASQEVPAGVHLMNLIRLCQEVLEPLREEVGVPIHVNSGFRSSKVNEYVHGVETSAHLKGCAADITFNLDDRFATLSAAYELLKKNPMIDQCIWYKKRSFLHVGIRPYRSPLLPRNQFIVHSS